MPPANARAGRGRALADRRRAGGIGDAGLTDRGPVRDAGRAGRGRSVADRVAARARCGRVEAGHDTGVSYARQGHGGDVSVSWWVVSMSYGADVAVPTNCPTGGSLDSSVGKNHRE